MVSATTGFGKDQLHQALRDRLDFTAVSGESGRPEQGAEAEDQVSVHPPRPLEKAILARRPTMAIRATAMIHITAEPPEPPFSSSTP